MGGHGGLNILPQKSWHVYRKDNVSKVERDEAKAREAEEEAQVKHQDAEREYRRHLMLQRASESSLSAAAAAAAAVCGSSSSGRLQGLVAPCPHATDMVYQQENPVPVAATAPVAAPEQQAAVEHINFWSMDEAHLRAQHPEVAAEKRNEVRTRGDANTYTTDAKFDERFKLCHGLTGDQPWYAQKPHQGDSGSQPADPMAAAMAKSTSEAAMLQGRPGPGQHSHRLGAGRGGVLAPAALPALLGRSEKRGSGEGCSGRSSGPAGSRPQPSPGSDSSDDSSSSGSGSSGSGSDSDSSSAHRSGKRGRKRRRSSNGGDGRRRSRGDSGEREEGGACVGSVGVRGKKEKDKRRRDDTASKKKSKKDKRDKRERKKVRRRRKEERSSWDGKRGRGSREGAVKSVEQLRADRLQREEAERGRERLLLMGMQPVMEPKGYNGAFGHGAALKGKR